MACLISRFKNQIIINTKEAEKKRNRNALSLGKPNMDIPSPNIDQVIMVNSELRPGVPTILIVVPCEEGARVPCMRGIGTTLPRWIKDRVNPFDLRDPVNRKSLDFDNASPILLVILFSILEYCN